MKSQVIIKDWVPKSSSEEILRALSEIVSILERLSPTERRAVQKALAAFEVR